jgi:hypothetical protein
MQDEVFTHVVINDSNNVPADVLLEKQLVDVLPKRHTRRPLKLSDELPLTLTSKLEEQFMTLQESPIWKDQLQIARWSLSNLEEGWHIFTLGYGTLTAYISVIHVVDERHIEMKGLWKSVVGTILCPVLVRGLGFPFLQKCVRRLDLHPDCLAMVSARKGYITMFDKNNVQLQMIRPTKKVVQGSSVPAQFFVRDLLFRP